MVWSGLGTKTTWCGLEKNLDNLRMKQKQQGNLAKFEVDLGVNPLRSLVIRQQILLHLLPDGSTVNRLWLVWFCLLVS